MLLVQHIARFLSGLVALGKRGLCLIYPTIYRFKVYNENIPLRRFLALAESHRDHFKRVIVDNCK